MKVAHKVGVYKEPGAVETILDMPDFDIEVICDGIHVPPVMVHLAYAVKGRERMALTTDALLYTGTVNFKDPTGHAIVEDGVCKLSDRSALAGSIATMDLLIRTAVQKANIPLIELSTCAPTRLPASWVFRIRRVLSRQATTQISSSSTKTSSYASLCTVVARSVAPSSGAKSSDCYRYKHAAPPCRSGTGAACFMFCSYRSPWLCQQASEDIATAYEPDIQPEARRKALAPDWRNLAKVASKPIAVIAIASMKPSMTSMICVSW